jgi:sugar/nucleoside kinase (ribokinase family)
VIALLGNLSRDLQPGTPPRTGGGPFHGARALQRLRVPARIYARAAEADRAALFPPLISLGTPARFVEGESTATFSFSYDGDVRTMQVEGLGDVWRPSDLPELPSTRWVHVAPLSRHEFPTETIAALARTHRVLLDGQGLVRVPATGPLRLDDDYDREILKHVWVLKLAVEEAEVVGDPTALGVREVLLTQGSLGSTVYYGGRSEFIPAHALDVDPTGAGDAFSTAYIVARNAGFSPPGAARRATAVVASVLSE